jgi:predicted acyl esterase
VWVYLTLDSLVHYLLTTLGYDLYRPEMNDELQGFFDRYCKGLENDWDKKPRFRLSLVGFNESQTPTVLEREESEWPIARTEYRKYFLDTQSNMLTNTPVPIECQTSHEGKHLTDSSDFYVRFDKYTELAGYPSAKLYMSCDQHDDMDVYVQIRKTDARGRLLISSNYPCPVPEPEVPSTNVAKFLGCDGMLRASHAVSKVADEGFTQYKHDKQQKIEKGAIVELDIPLWPIGMVFEAGEGIVLRVAGHDLRLPEFEHLAPTEATGPNVGRHQIFSGREHQSHLIVPVIADGKP